MASSSTDFIQEYQQAEEAYNEANYDVAATLIYQLVENFPEDPRARLLCGHIYGYGLQQYDVARDQYRAVIDLTDDPELRQYAEEGITYIESFGDNGVDVSGGMAQGMEYGEPLEEISLDEMSDYEMSLNAMSLETGHESLMEGAESEAATLLETRSSSATEDSLDLADLDFGGEELPLDAQLPDLEANPFAAHGDNAGLEAVESFDFEDPFALPEIDAAATMEIPFPSESHLNGDLDSSEEAEATEMMTAAMPRDLHAAASAETSAEFDLGDAFGMPDELGDVFASLDVETPASVSPPEAKATKAADKGLNGHSAAAKSGKGTSKSKLDKKGFNPDEREEDDETLLMRSTGELANAADLASMKRAFDAVPDLDFSNDKSATNGSAYQSAAAMSKNSFDDSSFDLDAFDEFQDAFPLDQDLETESFGSAPGNYKKNPESGGHQDAIDFLDEFDEFDDLGNIPAFDFDDPDRSSSFSNSDSDFGMIGGSGLLGATAGGLSFGDDGDGSAIRDDEMFSISSVASASVPAFTSTTEHEMVDTTVTVEQGGLAFWENAPLKTKLLYVAIGTGLASLFSVALVVNFAAYRAPQQSQREVRTYLRWTGLGIAAAAGSAGFLTAWGLGAMTAKQVAKSTDDLHHALDVVSGGNLSTRVSVYAEDEFGRLAAKFNHALKVIATTTFEAQRKAEEQEQAKEDLQRQVIRLLDDVEGAARGDLTVQAEVTADVLGAVADSFNLTIQNLREIVLQVKQAARQVAQGASDSERFAIGLSSDALRQAEELAATLNSVQMMTDLIQRVADNAREAEEVARSASAMAARGGESVERTVAGILEIRETVAETTRKVKRLAESTQEISKIVALIAAIASRTNLLALNASIEAARAGEAGRGFAIVADQVRQLADRSAKSVKEIEQIVMQIQSETGLVMTAMEEGTQQVIEGTRLAEKAKQSLEEIIQVSNRIDVLVRSITADTVEQTETSRAVAQVMQAVELTAQETSQEAQRVSSALQKLVGVARDLLTSVERFRVETSERP